MPKLGYHQTEVHKENIRKQLLGRTLDKSSRKKLSNSLYKYYKDSDNILKLKIRLNHCKHHLDLNTKNNKDSNIYRLSSGNHQRFHRYAYNYLFKKFGIAEILKYKKWFENNIITKHKGEIK
jgi:hypothetical protein